MTMESLQGDFKEVEQAASRLRNATSVAEIGAFVNDMLVPFLKNHVDESAQIDDVVCDLVEQAEDILQPETARLFVGAFAGGKVIADELRKRLTDSAEDQRLKLVIDEFDSNAKECLEVVAEITIPEEEDDPEAVDPDNDNEPDEDEEDDDETEGDPQ